MAKIWLEHIHIVTLDPMKLAAFYEKVFGAKRVFGSGKDTSRKEPL